MLLQSDEEGLLPSGKEEALLSGKEEGLLPSLPESPIDKHEKENDSRPESPLIKYEKESESPLGEEENQPEWALCFVKLPAATKNTFKIPFLKFGFLYLFALYVAEAGEDPSSRLNFAANTK